jgi:threonine dehydrogenase-like Zn-dependent dehydrogenase
MHRNTVVIAGGSPLGLSTVQVAHLKTPKRLVVIRPELRTAHILAVADDRPVDDLFERGLVTSRGIVTHDFPLGEWERAFTLANSTDSIKGLLKPGRT